MQSPATGATALAVDGKVMPNVGGGAQFTADGAHLFTQRMAAPIQNRPVTKLLLDGRPIARAEKFDVKIPPLGDRVVMVALVACKVPVSRSFGGAGALAVGSGEIPNARKIAGQRSRTLVDLRADFTFWHLLPLQPHRVRGALDIERGG
ncbi:MAG: hypothetical protein ABIT38_12590, partial [Gemmatimonadaceae bacterium]